MTKAVIFDLNGVFVQSPKLSERFWDEFGVPAEEFLPALKEIMAKVRMPNAGSSYAYWKPYLDKWNIGLSKEEFFNFWFSAEKEAPEMTKFARELKNRGVKIFILSNNFIERTAFYEKNFPFLKEIADKIYYSWQTGFVKPSKEAYLKLLTENNLKPEECLYFDDSKENTEIASELGIKSHVFKNTAELESELKKEFSLEGLNTSEPNNL
ncbi:MAG: HAD family phosphatase [Candidatus Yanofskybacteria bacterium]|nr:HAD family phosphatase [Candidatus Yanofskybacteria bacterium]